MTQDRLHYIVSDYFATGEGRCVSMMILSPEFEDEDYETVPKWYTNDQGHWFFEAGVLKTGHTEKVATARAFTKEFGDWYSRGAENLSREDFFERFGAFVPDFVKNITDVSKGSVPAFHWKQQVYFNFS